MLLLLELFKEEDELLADDDGDSLGRLGQYVNRNILRGNGSGAADTGARSRFVPACAAALADIRAWLQKISEQVRGAAMLGRATEPQTQEAYEFTHISLMQQHELLAVILSYAVERQMAAESDFVSFLGDFRRASKYDYFIGEHLGLQHPSTLSPLTNVFSAFDASVRRLCYHLWLNRRHC